MQSRPPILKTGPRVSAPRSANAPGDRSPPLGFQSTYEEGPVPSVAMPIERVLVMLSADVLETRAIVTDADVVRGGQKG